MKIILQSAVQDHCQDCTGGQSLSDHHTFLDESGTTTSLMTVRPNTPLTFTLNNRDLQGLRTFSDFSLKNKKTGERKVLCIS